MPDCRRPVLLRVDSQTPSRHISPEPHGSCEVQLWRDRLDLPTSARRIAVVVIRLQSSVASIAAAAARARAVILAYCVLYRTTLLRDSLGSTKSLINAPA